MSILIVKKSGTIIEWNLGDKRHLMIMEVNPEDRTPTPSEINLRIDEQVSHIHIDGKELEHIKLQYASHWTSKPSIKQFTHYSIPMKMGNSMIYYGNTAKEILANF